MRVDAQVDDTKITDRELKELFKCIDGGVKQDERITPDELRVFLAAKSDISKRPRSGKLGGSSTVATAQQANPRAASSSFSFIAEFVCVKKTAIRKSVSIDSKVRPPHVRFVVFVYVCSK